MKTRRPGRFPQRSVLRMALAAGAVAATMAAAAVCAAPSAVPAIAPLNAEDCAAMRTAHVIGADNPLPCERLARVRFAYVDFDGKQRQDGEMIVMDALAPHVQRLMAQLLAAKFPLHSALPMSHYAGDDAASMADDNSSAFNGRPVTGGGGWSKHAYGAAIDINPLQNPYVSHAANGSLSVQPAAAAPLYTDRGAASRASPAGMAEQAVALFADNGFLIWGGSWHQPIDYQHFEIGERPFIQKLARDTPQQAAQAFDRYVDSYRHCIASKKKDAALRQQCARIIMQSVR
ncbi:MAG: hypothetical protein JWP38_1182 [Herbaspirillum sp.]|jgi:hypothetical protein|nr:hypothetical protein [Herbaspirillum sp.]